MNVRLSIAITLALCWTVLVQELAEADSEHSQRDDEESEDEEEENTDYGLDDIDVICSKNTVDGNRIWTWMDVSDLDVTGHWREYGTCKGRKGRKKKFRFRAYELRNSSVYPVLKEHCLEAGYIYAQPTYLYPYRPVTSFGWPDRDLAGLNVPPSYELGCGRADSMLERRQRLANDGWFVFYLTEEDAFTDGFLTLDSCRRIELMSRFQLGDISCRDYKYGCEL